MSKTLHSQKNQIFLAMLRASREARRLRQSDLADLLGRSQAMVSNVERGERMLAVIELRDWLEALEVDFIGFLVELDNELRRLAVPRISVTLRKQRNTSGTPAVLKRTLRSIAGGDPS